jgi:hypothetical protein
VADKNIPLNVYPHKSVFFSIRVSLRECSLSNG